MVVSAETASQPQNLSLPVRARSGVVRLGGWSEVEGMYPFEPVPQIVASQGSLADGQWVLLARLSDNPRWEKCCETARGATALEAPQPCPRPTPAFHVFPP